MAFAGPCQLPQIAGETVGLKLGGLTPSLEEFQTVPEQRLHVMSHLLRDHVRLAQSRPAHQNAGAIRS